MLYFKSMTREIDQTSSITVAEPRGGGYGKLGMRLLEGFAYIALYLALDWVSFIYEFSPLGFTPWNPPPGLTVAFLLRTKPINTVWLLPASVLADGLVRGWPAPLEVIFLSGAILTVVYGGMAWLLRRSPRFNPDLRHLQDLLILFGATAIASALAGSFSFWLYAAAGLLE